MSENNLGCWSLPSALFGNKVPCLFATVYTRIAGLRAPRGSNSPLFTPGLQMHVLGFMWALGILPSVLMVAFFFFLNTANCIFH